MSCSVAKRSMSSRSLPVTPRRLATSRASLPMRSLWAVVSRVFSSSACIRLVIRAPRTLLPSRNLRRYMRSSARTKSCKRLSAAEDLQLTPKAMLSCLSPSLLARHSTSMHETSASASPSVVLGRIMANSSPPTRAKISPGRAQARKASADSRSISSPKA